MIISEQPGRVFAIIIVGPFLIYKGCKYKDNILKILGIIFIIYELFWIVNYSPKKIII